MHNYQDGNQSVKSPSRVSGCSSRATERIAVELNDAAHGFYN
jgi:hypothetical protein